jgi:uncharacterized protein YcgL (UPF0745 family)
MQCYVYRSRRKVDTYLYIAKRDDFEAVPEVVMNVFGPAEFALEFDLTPERKLSQETTEEVINNLTSRGFHLQLPKTEIEQQILTKILNESD